MKFHNIDQNSDEWLSLRLGKFTASTFSDIFMAKTTKGYQNAIIKVAFERVTGESQESYSNKWMKRGHEMEPFARDNYELLTFNTLENGGFYEYSDFIGASPDAKIEGENAGCEFKCPSFQVYNEYLTTNKLPKNYYWQIHGQLLCTGWDYIHYMPFLSSKLKQILIPVERDEAVIDQLKNQLNESIEEVKQLIERIRNE